MVPQGGSVQFTGPESVLGENVVNEEPHGCNSLLARRSGYSLSLLVRTPKCHLFSVRIFSLLAEVSIANWSLFVVITLLQMSFSLAANFQLILFSLATRPMLRTAGLASFMV